MRESMASRGCVIFVGNLPGDVREREVEDLFIKVGIGARYRPRCYKCTRLLLYCYFCRESYVMPCCNVQYGRIRHIDLKTPPRPPAFSFVEFEDPR